MTAATVPTKAGSKPPRCLKCNRAALPQGRPRYWQAWPDTGTLHLIYSTRIDRLAYTGCGRAWVWPWLALDRPDYLFPGPAPLSLDTLCTRPRASK